MYSSCGPNLCCDQESPAHHNRTTGVANTTSFGVSITRESRLSIIALILGRICDMPSLGIQDTQNYEVGSPRVRDATRSHEALRSSLFLAAVREAASDVTIDIGRNLPRVKCPPRCEVRFKITHTHGMVATNYRVNSNAALRLNYLHIWHQPSGASGIGDGHKRLMAGERRP